MKKPLTVFLVGLVFIPISSCSISIGLPNKDDETPCPKYVIPEREPLPKIPDIRGLTQDQANSLFINLIKQHRDYIVSEHKKLDENYTNYLTKCSLAK